MQRPKQEATGPASTLTFSSLTYTVKVKGETKSLTDNVSVTVQAGGMVGECELVMLVDRPMTHPVVGLLSHHGTIWCR